MIIVNESRMLSDIFFISFDTPIDEEMFNTELSYHNFRKNGIPFSKFISKNGKENTAPKGTVFSFWWRRGESLRRNCCGYTPTDFATVH
jgi:hypothetical protein